MKTNKIILALIFSAVLLSGCGNGDRNTISESGIVEIKSFSVSAQVPGKIISINVEEGSLVNKGDTIAVIDHQKLDYQLMQAEANLAAAKAQYELLKNGARKEDITSANQAYSQAKTNFELAKKDFDRINQLFENNSATEKQVDDASSRLKIAEARLKQAEAANKKIKNFARPEELKKAEAAVKAAEAAVLLVKNNIDDAIITSPTSGFISEFYYEIGEIIPAYSVLCDILNGSEAEIEIYISETDLGKISTGMEASIYSDSFPDAPIKGKITQIAEEAEFTPKTIQTKEERTKLVYKVTIKANNPENKLKGGMPVDVEIAL